jgi:hypothetical protein
MLLLASSAAATTKVEAKVTLLFKVRTLAHLYQSHIIDSNSYYYCYFDLYVYIEHQGKGKRSKDHVEKINANDIEPIDLCTPVNELSCSAIVTTSNMPQDTSVATNRTVVTANVIVAPAAIAALNQTSYESRTLTPNSERHSILPAFPASNENNRPDLLLANVPSK